MLVSMTIWSYIVPLALDQALHAREYDYLELYSASPQALHARE